MVVVKAVQAVKQSQWGVMVEREREREGVAIAWPIACWLGSVGEDEQNGRTNKRKEHMR
jgi:hypothetical protein